MSRVSGVAELVRSMLLRGEVAPGRRLVELELAQRLDVGRSTLREALRKLEGEGLLVADSAGGMRVIALDAGDVDDALHVRMALEALGAGLAARRVRDGDAAPRELAALHDRVETADTAARWGTPEAAVIADRHVHRAVTALGAGRSCRAALEHAWDRILLATATAVVAPERIAGPAGDHHALLAAVTAGDADGASAIAHRHVLASLASLA